MLVKVARRLARMDLRLPPLQTVDLEGPLAYRTWDGPAETTFVMVHGLGGTHINWALVAPGLSGLGTVLAPDLAGFGRSPLSGRGTGLMDLRRTLSMFIQKLASGRVVVCGNSMGGAISVLQAAVEPDTVDRLVLTSSVFPVDGKIFPHPLVMGAFATYASPRAGERLVVSRFKR